MNGLTHLECSRTGERYDAGELHNLSAAGAPLLARYDLDAVAASWKRDSLAGRPADMWRYREVMPLRPGDDIVTLGEGFTPLFRAERLGAETGLRQLYIKDESTNPTGSFKARGLPAAVTAAAARGARALAIP
ncbi:MAG: pyridoxal-phosphate dependent enzyme, partial [Gemmatimonadetes bacterium]|nr:pyridoxal-phosphate dependent enzyme [Gemmatimonadota bacterium]